MNSGIYAIENTINGHRYIGSAVDFDARRRQHFAELRRGAHANRHLQNAFRQYGEDAFRFVVLLRVDRDELLDAEQAALDNLHPEYNIAANVSAPMMGRKHTEETKQKLRDANIGKVMSPEAVEKSAAAKRGRPRPDWGRWLRANPSGGASSFKGKTHSEASRAKIGAAQIGNHKHLGHRHTAEARAKMGRAGNAYALGHAVSEDARSQMRAAKLGKPWSPARRAAYEARRQRESQ